MNGTLHPTAFTDGTGTANPRAVRRADWWRLGWRAGRVLSLGAAHLVRVWHIRRRVRRDLRDFSDRELKDIGLSRANARAEVRAPLWLV